LLEERPAGHFELLLSFCERLAASAAVKHAAIVARAGPQLVALLGIVDECAQNGVFRVSAYCFKRLIRFLAIKGGVYSDRKT